MAECRDNIIGNAAGKQIYSRIQKLPIIDFHCHLSPKEIYEDKTFTDIGDIMLGADHYKWRLMRTAGINEKYITGDAPMREKFKMFIACAGTAIHSPVKAWTEMELSEYFGITLNLNAQNADRIWEQASAAIEEKKLSPRKIIEAANVEYIATTDDMADDLYYHERLADYKVKVAPTFRTDSLFLMDDITAYNAYLHKLGMRENINIDSLDCLKEVIKRRLSFFKARGAVISDIGVEGFPSRIASDAEADAAFKRLLSGNALTADERDGLCGNLYYCLGQLYAENGITSQWHVAVTRNANSRMLSSLGRDSGFDCVGEAIDSARIRNMLDALNSAGKLPKTIIYNLNPAMNYPLITLTGAFRGVRPGISWWFNDHIRGMRETLSAVSELQHITSLAGMVTDSRSFLSYVRHDYFRRILADFLGDSAGEDYLEEATEAAIALAYGNAKSIIGG